MREPVHYPGAFLVEDADIPPELTIAQWREQRARERREQHADRRQAARARRRALLVALLTFGRRAARRRTGCASATLYVADVRPLTILGRHRKFVCSRRPLGGLGSSERVR